MSVLYPDLSLTAFPGDIDSFTTWLDIIASDGALVLQYQQAMQAGNTVLANQILAQIPSATQKIIKATDLNKMTQAILAVERFYKTDVEPYIQEQQANWLEIIQRFSYKGEWASGTTYEVNNFVSYTVSGATLIYLATSNPPVGTPPTNTNYWRLLSIQGQQGPSGEGVSYRQEWNSSTQYYTDDTVTYGGALWIATQNSQGQTPQSGSQYWQLVMSLGLTTYPIQDSEPTGQEVGGLWFNTQVNPTNYYQLATLENPATAAQISAGYEAYNDDGEVITGTASAGNSAKTVRFVIGTSTAGWTADDVDFLCDGTADDVEINAAISSLPSTGGAVLILDGTYNITAAISINKPNTTISGNGASTILKRMWGSSTSEGVINITATNGGCIVEKLQINGNKSNYTSWQNSGIRIFSSDNNVIIENICNNSYYGIDLASAENNTVTGNACNNNYGGIYLNSSENSTTVTGNTCNNNDYGIFLSDSNNNTVTGNTCNNNNTGVRLFRSSNNTVTGNTCIRGTGQASDYTSRQYTIVVAESECENNLFVGNNIMGKNYVDSGTNSTWANNKYN